MTSAMKSAPKPAERFRLGDRVRFAAVTERRQSDELHEPPRFVQRATILPDGCDGVGIVVGVRWVHDHEIVTTNHGLFSTRTAPRTIPGTGRLAWLISWDTRRKPVTVLDEDVTGKVPPIVGARGQSDTPSARFLLGDRVKFGQVVQKRRTPGTVRFVEAPLPDGCDGVGIVVGARWKSDYELDGIFTDEDHPYGGSYVGEDASAIPGTSRLTWLVAWDVRRKIVTVFDPDLTSWSST